MCFKNFATESALLRGANFAKGSKSPSSILPQVNFRALQNLRMNKRANQSEILALKHESRIPRQWFNPVWGSRKSQASFPFSKQHIVQPVPSWKKHTQGWMNVRESYTRALEQETLEPMKEPSANLHAKQDTRAARARLVLADIWSVRSSAPSGIALFLLSISQSLFHTL